MNGNKYALEFILAAQGVSAQEISKSLAECAEKIEVSISSEGEFKVCARTQDPKIVFDTCAQFGRIKSAKINEGGK